MSLKIKSYLLIFLSVVSCVIFLLSSQVSATHQTNHGFQIRFGTYGWYTNLCGDPSATNNPASAGGSCAHCNSDNGSCATSFSTDWTYTFSCPGQHTNCDNRGGGTEIQGPTTRQFFPSAAAPDTTYQIDVFNRDCYEGGVWVCDPDPTDQDFDYDPNLKSYMVWYSGIPDAPPPGGTCRTAGLSCGLGASCCSGLTCSNNVCVYSGGTPTTYGCSDGACVVYPGSTGPYTTSNCNNNCTAGGRYSCSGSSCVANASGPYTTADCNRACVPHFACSGSSCVANSIGSYLTSDCNSACAPPPSFCPGFPACGVGLQNCVALSSCSQTCNRFACNSTSNQAACCDAPNTNTTISANSWCSAGSPEIGLNWTYSGAYPYGNLLQRSENGGAFTTIGCMGESVAYIDTAVIPGTSYSYKVIPYTTNSCTTQINGNYTASTPVTANACVTPPVITTLDPFMVSASTITLAGNISSWGGTPSNRWLSILGSRLGAGPYALETGSTLSTGIFTASQGSILNFATLVSGTPYYAIAVANNTSQQTRGQEISFTPIRINASTAPGNCIAGNPYIDLSWNDPGFFSDAPTVGVNSYRITRQKQGESNWVDLNDPVNCPLNNRFYNICRDQSGLVSGANYTYAVAAYNTSNPNPANSGGLPVSFYQSPTSVTAPNCAAPSAPGVDLKINGSDGPVCINAGDSATLSWVTAGSPTSCNGTGGSAGWPGPKNIAGGSEATSALSTSGSPYTYTIACSKPGFSDAVDSVTANVSATGCVSTITPWIQTEGDVHSQTNIYTPGGP